MKISKDLVYKVKDMGVTANATDLMLKAKTRDLEFDRGYKSLRIGAEGPYVPRPAWDNLPELLSESKPLPPEVPA